MPTLKKKPKVPESSRKVVYPKVSAALHDDSDPITEEIAKTMLGWQKQDEKAVDYDLIDYDGNKVKLCHNATNRPIYQTVYLSLKQEILRKRWVLNGETIIVGQTGTILNGQHSLIGFILAVQEWKDNPEKWPEWEEEPTITKVVVTGISEADSVVNTMDTCKPRSFADVLYRSNTFANVKKSDLRKLSRVLDFAVKMLWHRTGLDRDAFAPRRTHSEGLAFLANHPKLIECVRHIYEEDGDRKQIGRYISTGYAAGMMYLMASSKTQTTEEYKENPRESNLDMSLWDEACEFWVKIAAGEKSFNPLKVEFQKMIEEMHSSLPERSALIVKAWNTYSAGSKITPASVKLKYDTDEDGFSKLAEYPEIGGIDHLEPVSTSVDPSPEELEERAEEIKAERAAKKKNGKKAKTASIPKVGDQVWIPEPDDGGFSTGKVVEVYEGANGLVCKVKFKTGKVFEESTDNCLTVNPLE